MYARHHLQRFVEAQDKAYDRALDELRRGRKTSHWMWFVFPQVAGLGNSAMAQRYAITSLHEARAYLEHPILGARLREATEAMNAHVGRTAREILGSPDDAKFRSCMTLFEIAAPEEPCFATALTAFFEGSRDPRTLAALGRG
jgi:uncharacterized protein (DUF1810 family)